MSALSTLRILISYSWDSPAHRNKVLRLANRLREDGIECIIDQYVAGTLPEGWPLWMQHQIEKADFVVMVCTESYERRVTQREEPGIGRGVVWEGKIIYNSIYHQQAPLRKFVPVLFDGGRVEHIPTPLRDQSFYFVETEEGYQALYRHLLGQPESHMPPLGERKRLARLPRQYDRFWTVPFARNEFFTGREDELKQLREMLTGAGAAALSQTAAIHGLGGVGKTQTAVEYAWRYRDDYEAVFWVPADEDTTIRKAFCEMAQRLDLPQKDAAEQDLIIAAVLRWLEANSGWLLIFDNADTPDLVVPYRPAGAAGHILLTSRESVFDCLGIRQALPLEKMPADEAQAFLLRRADRATLLELELNPRQQAERQAAAELVVALDCLALALEQAGAYLKAHKGTSIADYLSEYKKRGVEMLALMAPQIGHRQAGDRKSVAATWSMNFEQVEKTSPAAADLLRFFALLHADDIPWELITAGAPELGEHLSIALSGDNALAFGELLRALTRYSLIKIDESERTCSIHRLVQEVLKLQLARAGQLRTWQERMVRAVSEAFPDVEFENWPTCERLVPQAQVAAKLIFAEKVEFLEAARLLNDIGSYAKGRGRYAEAKPLCVQSLVIYEDLLGPEHPVVATMLNHLALLHSEQGHYGEAETLYVRALAICEMTLGPEYPDLAASLGNLALLYDLQGRYSEAEPLHVRALAMRQEALGLEHPDVATSLNNLALLYQHQGRYAESESLYLRALAIRENALGPDHPYVSTSLNNLAELYRAQSRYAEAASLHTRALAIRQKALAPDHPDIAQSLNNLACVYQHQGRYAEAEALYVRTLEIWEKALGPEHPHVATSLNNLADLYCTEGPYPDAERLYVRALAIRENALGPEHPDMAQSLIDPRIANCTNHNLSSAQSKKERSSV